MEPTENQIIVYQPNGVMKIDVRFDGETVWLLQAQIAELFSCSLENVRLHLKNIYACGELEKTATSKESLEVRKEGNRSVTRKFLYYNLDAIISIGYRVNSIVGVRFRQWATQIIKERMFAGAALAAQFAAIDRRLLSHEKDIVELKDKVDFFRPDADAAVAGCVLRRPVVGCAGVGAETDSKREAFADSYRQLGEHRGARPLREETQGREAHDFHLGAL